MQSASCLSALSKIDPVEGRKDKKAQFHFMVSCNDFYSWVGRMRGEIGREVPGEAREGSYLLYFTKGQERMINRIMFQTVSHNALKHLFFSYSAHLVKCSVLELLNTQSFPICYFYSSVKYNFPSLPTVPDNVPKLIVSVSHDYCWFWRTDCLLTIFSFA